jgi:hypothetical protein
MTPEDATKAIKTFLESAPLLKPLRVTLDKPSRSTSDLLPASIQIPCSHQACRELEATTWTIVPRIAGVQPSFHDDLVFRCAHCRASQVEMWCRLAGEKTVKKREGATLTNTGIGGTERDYVVEFEILKVGQWPPWTPVVSRRLEKNLGKNLEFFRRAVACIRQSWGIGACAYMRRVVEEETDHILDLVERAAKAEGDEETLENVIAARQGRAASDRLHQAAKKLPRSLCPGGVNPLARLFDAFSEGVHHLPEDKALDLAQELLETFVFLFENLRERIEVGEAFANKIQGVGNPGNRND